MPFPRRTALVPLLALLSQSATELVVYPLKK